MKCTIRWIDSRGKDTPDDNKAVQYCRTKASIFEREDGSRLPTYPSPWFPICAEHSKRLNGLSNWESKPLFSDAELGAIALDII